MKIRMLAPVAFLVTGACFATRNDVLVLQQDVRNARRDTEIQIERLNEVNNTRLAELERVLQSFMDSVRAFQQSFYSTGGNLADNQGRMQQNVERLMARLELFFEEQKKQGADINLLKERFDAWSAVVVAADSALVPPDPGPVEKLDAGKAQLARGAFATARARFHEVIEANPDSSVLAEAYSLVADTYFAEGLRTEADSVFRIVYERFPNTTFAPPAMYRHGLSLKNSMQVEEARAIFRRILQLYPTAPVAAMAREQLGGGGIVDTVPRRPDMN